MFAIAPLLSNCVWVDLVFTQMKNAHNFNKCEEPLGNTLVNIINNLHRDFNECWEVLNGYPSGASKHLHTLPQIVSMSVQAAPGAAAEVCVEKHGGNPWPKSSFSALDSSPYKNVAERTLEVKNTRIAKGKGRSDKEWDDNAALNVGMANLSMQLLPEAVQALGL